MASAYERILDTADVTLAVTRARLVLQQLDVLAALAPWALRRLERRPSPPADKTQLSGHVSTFLRHILAKRSALLRGRGTQLLN